MNGYGFPDVGLPRPKELACCRPPAAGLPAAIAATGSKIILIFKLNAFTFPKERLKFNTLKLRSVTQVQLCDCIQKATLDMLNLLMAPLNMLNLLMLNQVDGPGNNENN